MKKTAYLYFLLLAVPALVMPFAAHRILEGELARGKAAGLASLAAQAELALVRPSAVDGAVATGDAPPADGRCCGAAVSGNGRKTYAWWRGDVPRGELHRRRIRLAETAVYSTSLAVFALGLVLLLRALAGARAEARRQREFIADFAHRLKTPLTSISLCAELAGTGRLPEGKIAESAETVVREAGRLNGIVDEVLGFLEARRNG